MDIFLSKINNNLDKFAGSASTEAKNLAIQLLNLDRRRRFTA